MKANCESKTKCDAKKEIEDDFLFQDMDNRSIPDELEQEEEIRERLNSGFNFHI
jgi:hypothetical protein